MGTGFIKTNKKEGVTPSLSAPVVHNSMQHACRVMTTFQLPSGLGTQGHVGTMTLGLTREKKAVQLNCHSLKVLLLRNHTSANRDEE